MSEIWNSSERRAWKWPDRLKPSQWAEQFRILPAHVTAEPGPWRNERTPYLAGIMDAVHEPGIEGIVCLKAAQIGWSEAIRNLLGFFIDADPGPSLLVMPDQKSAEELVDERIKPLLEFTPAVARHVSTRAWDVKKWSIKLDTMSIYLGWAGSSQALKSRPIRYLFLDEPDEYPKVSGNAGDPISKALKRITTYQAKDRARVFLGGTPTLRSANVWKYWEGCGDRRHFWLPCPHCGKYQTLQWKQVKWPKLESADRAKQAARMEAESLAYYECEHCQGRINETMRSRMLQRGAWAGEDQVVTPDGRVAGPAIKAKWVGFQISSLYSPYVSFSKLAAEWLKAQDDTQELCDFINQRLAEPFEQQRQRTMPEWLAEKAKGAPEPMQVPAWARFLVATADTQGNNEQDGYFWYVIRAWGYGYRSQLIDFGVAQTKPELVERCLNRPIATEGNVQVTPQMLLVDSGGPRKGEVYELCQSDNRIIPAKGAPGERTLMVREHPQKLHRVLLWEIDTEQSKDMLQRLMHDPDQTRWMVHNKINDDYCSQMTSEAKVFDPQAGRERWVEVVKKNNHLFDCEANQCAVAFRLGAGLPEPVRPETPPAPRVEQSANPLNYRGRW